MAARLIVQQRQRLTFLGQTEEEAKPTETKAWTRMEVLTALSVVVGVLGIVVYAVK